MYELALFAGAGGGLLCTKWLLGWRTVCYVEREPYCVSVLTARMRDGLLDHAPVWDDANTFDGRPWRGLVDVVSAGFPCQPFSVAGQRKAEEDGRNGWPATIRIIRECQPRFALLENVPGLLAGGHGYFGQILAELAECGMDAVWGVRSAASVGAPHIRKRLFVLAYAQGAGPSDGGQAGAAPGADEAHGPMAQPRPERRGRAWWATEPRVGRVAHGVAHRVDRIAAIGNGQVPQVVAEVWAQLMRIASCTS